MKQISPGDVRFVFFGTPQIAVATLDALEAAGYVPAAVVTQPDRPVGRGHVLTSPPVAEWAHERGIDVLQPDTIDDDFIAELGNTEWDVFIVVAYGKILPLALLDMPKRGSLNVHFSLLPRLRGASPVRSAILTDERVTGVTIMRMDEKLDHGPIVAQARVEVEDWPPRAPVLEGILTEVGADLLVETLPAWLAGTAEVAEQDHDSATFCKKISKEDGLLDLSADSYQNLLKIRAFEGWPGTYTYFTRNGERIRVAIIDAHIDEAGKLVIDTVKPEGKKEMPYQDFLRSGATPA